MKKDGNDSTVTISKGRLVINVPYSQDGKLTASGRNIVHASLSKKIGVSSTRRPIHLRLVVFEDARSIEQIKADLAASYKRKAEAIEKSLKGLEKQGPEEVESN